MTGQELLATIFPQMPYTLNGIGTRYYGKAHLQRHTSTCRHCGRQVALSSYDTRLWFVVFFVPIIPLGRKHIIDECPSCRRHFVAEAEKWDMARQLETSGAMEKFRSEPSAENAIEAHQHFVRFHRLAEAKELQRTMQEKFADNARVQIYLGDALTQFGKLQEGHACYQRALALRPDVPEARIGVAEALVRGGQLHEARQMLDFLEKSGAAQLYSLAPLERLALAYQRAGQHTAALEIFGNIIQGLPAVGQNAAFRKEVKKSEKALRRSTTILPKAKFNWKEFLSTSRSSGARPSFGLTGKQGVIVVAVLGGLVMAAILTADAISGHNRTLYIVNGTTSAVTVELSGHGALRIRNGVTPVQLSEGHYTAKLNQSQAAEMDLDLHTPFLGRWLHSPVWVLNLDGEAIIIRQQVIYAKNPQDGSFSYDYGRKLAYYPDVDFPFTTPPATMSLSSGTERLVKSALTFFRGTPLDAYTVLRDKRRPNEASALAEWRLANHPEDKVMLQSYVTGGQSTGNGERVQKFLHAGLARRPVAIEWHRTYQNLKLDRDRSGLVQEYDQMLTSEPGDSSLLYLRGRLCINPTEGRDYFLRSLRANPENPFPAFALAYDAMTAPDWATAKKLLDRPVEQHEDNVEFLTGWTMACLGLNQPALVESAWRRRLKAEPANLTAALNICQALLISQDESAARAVASEFSKTVSPYGKDGRLLADMLDFELLYMTGDFAAIEKAARNDPSPAGRNHLLVALIEEGHPAAAAEIHPLADPSVIDPYQPLEMSIAWALAGDSDEAAKWQKRAAEMFRKSGDRNQAAADLLEGRAEPTPANIGALLIAAPLKATLRADLALTHPERREELAAAARRLNVLRPFPITWCSAPPKSSRGYK